MTLAEIERWLSSRMRVNKYEERKLAMSNYKLADLIGRSIARIHNSNNKYPSIIEAYPELFSSEEERKNLQTNKDEVSAIRFKLFAQSFNKKFDKEAK